MILSFVISGVIALILILIARTHQTMNIPSLLHPLAIFILGVLDFRNKILPAMYLKGYFSVDFLSLLLVVVSAVLFFLAALYARGYVQRLIEEGELPSRNLKLFYVTLNLLLMALTLAYFANNLALFWILMELTTLFSAVLVASLNAKENITAALKYVFIAGTAMLFSFVGLILLFTASQHALGKGTLNFDVLLSNASTFQPAVFALAFIFIFIGFAAKSGIVPFHSWLPPVYAKAPSAVSVLLAGSVSSVGMYGLLRITALARHSSAQHFTSTLLIFFGILSIAIAVFSMFPRTNIKKLIAFSSVENMGLMVLGMGIGSPVAIFWVIFHSIAHAFSKALLFFSAGILHRQYHSAKMEAVKDALQLQPMASWGLILGTLSIIGMPFFPLFFSKMFLLIELGKVSGWLVLLVLLLLLIAASAFAFLLMRMFSQRAEEGKKQARWEVPRTMGLSVLFSLLIVILLGIYFPSSLQNIITTIVTQLGFN